MIYILQHAAHESPGLILDWMAMTGNPYQLIHLYAGDALPGLDANDGLVIMGGPMNVYEEKQYPWLMHEKRMVSETIRQGNRVLGICLGAQLIAAALGATIRRNVAMELGWFMVEIEKNHLPDWIHKLFPDKFISFHWHGDTFDVPAGVMPFAASEATRNQGFYYNEKVMALQFHPEMTIRGMEELIRVNASDVLSESVFVQKADEMRKGAYHIPENKAILFSLLEHLFSSE